MPYKIYTYADPYNLDKADFWNEISSLPHFCGARTLVNGLKDVLGDSIKGLICNLDALSYTINIQHLLSLVKLLNPRRIHRNVRL